MDSHPSCTLECACNGTSCFDPLSQFRQPLPTVCNYNLFEPASTTPHLRKLFLTSTMPWVMNDLQHSCGQTFHERSSTSHERSTRSLQRPSFLWPSGDALDQMEIFFQFPWNFLVGACPKASQSDFCWLSHDGGQIPRCSRIGCFWLCRLKKGVPNN